MPKSTAPIDSRLADRQQVGRSALQVQAHEREQQGQRNRHRDDQTGAHVEQEEDQHGDHQHHAQQQVVHHHGLGLLDQVGEVVERVDLHVPGQDLAVELDRLRLDPLQHVLGLGAGQRQHHAFDSIVLVHVAELAEARRDADLHGADVLHQDRRAVMHRQHHVADVLHRLQSAQPAHIEELPALRVEAAAGIAVVGGQRRFHLCHRQAERGDLQRIEQHLVLHGAAAETGVVGDAGHRAVLRRNHPVVDRLQFHRRAIGALQHVAIYQPGRRRHRRHRRRHAIGQGDAGQPVVDALARKVVIGAVGKSQRDVGQAVQRNGAFGDQPGDRVQTQLHRHRDQPLHFLRRMSRPLRDDVHHRRRQVGIGVHRQGVVGPHTGRSQAQRQQHHQHALLQREGDDAVDQRGPARRRPLGRCLRAHWVCMNCRKIAPSTTTWSPACSPPGITKRSSTRAPSVTVRCA